MDISYEGTFNMAKLFYALGCGIAALMIKIRVYPSGYHNTLYENWKWKTIDYFLAIVWIALSWLTVIILLCLDGNDRGEISVQEFKKAYRKAVSHFFLLITVILLVFLLACKPQQHYTKKPNKGQYTCPHNKNNHSTNSFNY